MLIKDSITEDQYKDAMAIVKAYKENRRPDTFPAFVWMLVSDKDPNLVSRCAWE